MEAAVMVPSPKPGSKAFEILQKTIYGEARGEGERGKKAVAWVIKNRVDQGKAYWGGADYEKVCRMPGQFECWNNKSDIVVTDDAVFAKIGKLIYDPETELSVYDSDDPTDSADHFHNPPIDVHNNPKTGGKPNWLPNCDFKCDIGKHRFYRTKPEYRK
ncbi:hypothetical protein BV898_16139 [Hypsibius exemplaris]|uniref:Cell wall hydrolase SleB domain-containing protein n=1 Tax=Hypsibius exemplaris TaxID=2072580 RepID=A0A9X6NCP1_HYPEX|nr:hypothetical protein BV898_16139 [Hypsibius exemplaris]